MSVQDKLQELAQVSLTKHPGQTSFYGLGLLSYIVASADGDVQDRERHKLQEVFELHENDKLQKVRYDAVAAGFADAENAGASVDLEGTFELAGKYMRSGGKVDLQTAEDMRYVLNIVAKAVFSLQIDLAERRWLNRSLEAIKAIS